MKKQSIRPYLLSVLVLLVVLPAAAAPTASEDELDWFEDDFEELTREVNEGELRFLAQPPRKPVHHHHNVITLEAESLQHGWALLRQCHYNIDEVARAQILFRQGRIRNLNISASENIGKAWVEGASVQLSNIEKESSLCLEAESLVLTADDNGGFRVNNGPFMRRFLDGYYPMRVSVQLMLADSGLRFAGITPERQPGFTVEITSDSIRFDAWFEGRLRTEIELAPAHSPLAGCSPSGYLALGPARNC